MIQQNIQIAIIGMGYVGLPLAVEFAKQYPVVASTSAGIGQRVKYGHDSTLEVSDSNLQSVLKTGEQINVSRTGLYITTKMADIASCNCYIVQSRHQPTRTTGQYLSFVESF
jgi:UDP-N-acetyl-D-galactosamine dehydrogenase